jgi:coiled-coil domain-containing protein 55
MNISLGKSKAKKKKIGFGLNNRSSSGAAASNNVFGDAGDDDDDDDDDDGGSSGAPGDARRRINQQISKEQAALRQRAQAAMANSSSTDGGIFDYDGAYDSFKPPTDAATKKQADNNKEDRKSKYIGDLLETAKKRQRDREAVFERKVAKEQALEDAQEDFAGKEKFVTKAYRRKLEERKQWEAEEQVRKQEEEVNDVTKQKTAGAAMASFYGNFANNVAMGGGDKQEEEDAKEESDKKKVIGNNDSDDDFLPAKGGGMDFLSGFQRSDDQEPPPPEEDADTMKAPPDNNEDGPTETPLTARERREQKVAAARIRYLERKGAAPKQ